jgi:GNAT superfamily N-acetyltransferase
VKIRKAAPSDASHFAKWLSDPLIHPYCIVEPGKEAEFLAHTWSEPVAYATSFVALRGGRPVGLAFVSGTPYHKASHWNALTLIVDPKEWGKGIGTALLSEAETWARTAKIERFVIELFESPAQPWFERRGFMPFSSGPSALKIGETFRMSTKLKKEWIC